MLAKNKTGKTILISKERFWMLFICPALLLIRTFRTEIFEFLSALPKARINTSFCLVKPQSTEQSTMIVSDWFFFLDSTWSFSTKLSLVEGTKTN